MSKDKLILGMPTYGRSFSGATSNKPASSSTGPGAAGRVAIKIWFII